jgi:hypothetical protein
MCDPFKKNYSEKEEERFPALTRESSSSSPEDMKKLQSTSS